MHAAGQRYHHELKVSRIVEPGPNDYGWVAYMSNDEEKRLKN
jgi:hypothetical protein